VVALRHGSCLIASLALVGCGRIGYDKLELASDVDSGTSVGDIDSGAPGLADAAVDPVDAMPPAPVCPVEVLLASTDTENVA
jgi:hypothetical protein